MLIQSFRQKEGLAHKIAKPIIAATLFVVMTAAITAGSASNAEACGNHFQNGLRGIHSVATMDGTNSMGTPLNGSLALDSNDVSGTIVQNMDPFGLNSDSGNSMVSSADDLAASNSHMNQLVLDGVVSPTNSFSR